MRGKEKCKALKEIRRQIAEENDIPYVVSQCSYQGDCKGTCPKCEAELRYLERELAIRQGLGKAVAVVGISASVCGGLTACSPVETVRNVMGIGVVETAGDIAMPEEEAGPEEASPLPDAEGPGGKAAENTESPQDGMEQLPEGGAVSGGEDSLPEGAGESQSRSDELAGRIPFPEDEPVMGEVLPLPESEEGNPSADVPGVDPREDMAVPESSDPELEGDIALPEEGEEGGARSVFSSGETGQ